MATGTYEGDVSGTDIMSRSTYQTLSSTQKISKGIQWACFKKTPFMQAVGVEAFDVEGMSSLDKFGAAKSTGRIIQYDSGVYAIGGTVMGTTGTGFHVGRLGNFTPELVEGGDEWAYAWFRLVHAQFIPDVDVQDNSKGYFSIMAQKLEGIKQQYVEEINYCFLGNSSAPDHGTYGPAALYCDLPNLISVTQSRLVGGITKAAASIWTNGSKAITSVGGGGEMDRPITMRRSMMDAKNDQSVYAETTDDYLTVASQGAWQYYDRLMYADTVQSGQFPVSKKYDAAGINHKAFDGSPVVWDPAVTVPYGATASTESFYGIHIPSYFISFRTEEAFKVTGWEPPREHDVQRTHVLQVRTRYTPGVTAMRPHFVCYNIPACPD